ncbi:spore cortex biosynthesis protein YabQ [Bacillus sp. OV322]|nr:spore cortex biosynthesis protein YabQ [Bacillus sp. OV322]SFD01498.1 spore cortex biosynthesis protein YabQ [Bacillus sp. OV322]
MTLSTQFYTLIAMIGMGSCFGAALDTYNLFLKRSRRQGWIVFINDFLFWIVQALIIFYVLFTVNEGELRLYLFLALLCGFAAYQSLFKGMYMRGLKAFIFAVVSVARFAGKSFKALIISPIKWILSSILFLILAIGKAVYLLLKGLCKSVLFILLIIFKPFLWILKGLWNILPKFVTNNVGKSYNIVTGLSDRTKKFIIRTLHRWRNKKE